MVGLEARAEELASLAVEGEARLHGLKLAVSLLELTALQDTETPGAVRELCAAAAAQGVASVCVHQRLVAPCRERLAGSGIRVASVATPAEARRASELGAEEVAVALDAASFLAGAYAAVVDQVSWVRESIADARLRVVVPARELGSYESVARAARLAAIGGADFVGDPAGTLPGALCILDTIRDLRDDEGRTVGFAQAGVSTAEQALRLLVLVHEALGAEWLRPDRCRLAGAALLEQLLAELTDTLAAA